jgi:hypothetical protein
MFEIREKQEDGDIQKAYNCMILRILILLYVCENSRFVIRKLSRIQAVGMLLEHIDKDCVIRIENVKKDLDITRTERNIQQYTKPGSTCGENCRCRIPSIIRRIGRRRYRQDIERESKSGRKVVTRKKQRRVIYKSLRLT